MRKLDYQLLFSFVEQFGGNNRHEEEIKMMALRKIYISLLFLHTLYLPDKKFMRNSWRTMKLLKLNFLLLSVSSRIYEKLFQKSIFFLEIIIIMFLNIILISHNNYIFAKNFSFVFVCLGNF